LRFVPGPGRRLLLLGLSNCAQRDHRSLPPAWQGHARPAGERRPASNGGPRGAGAGATLERGSARGPARADRGAAAGPDPALLPGSDRGPGGRHHGQVGRRRAGASASSARFTRARAARTGSHLMPEARRLEALAERLRTVDPIAPSPGAKIRGWNLVLAGVTQSATRRPRVSVTRLVLAAAAAGVLLVAGALAASADSLPDSALYPLKGAWEQVRGTLAFSPSAKLAFHLELSQTRPPD